METGYIRLRTRMTFVQQREEGLESTRLHCEFASCSIISGLHVFFLLNPPFLFPLRFSSHWYGFLEGACMADPTARQRRQGRQSVRECACAFERNLNEKKAWSLTGLIWSASAPAGEGGLALYFGADAVLRRFFAIGSCCCSCTTVLCRWWRGRVRGLLGMSYGQD